MKKLKILAVALGALAVAGSALAIPTLTISDGTTTATVINPTGVVNYTNGSFDSGVWSVVAVTGETKPALGSASNPRMDLSIQITSLGPNRPLFITFSDNSFGPPPTNFQATLTGHLTSGTGSTITYNTYYDAANVTGAETALLTTSGILAPPIYSSTSTGGPINQAPCSLTQVVTIGGAPGGSYTLDASLFVATSPPVFTSVPTGGSLGCNPANAALPTDASVKAQVTASGNCGVAATNVTHLDGGSACASNRTFTITINDACGNTNSTNVVYTWTADTTPPVLACATNKTVQCGTAWNFDPPTGSDVCSGTNLTISVLSTATNGVAQITFTGGGSAANGQVVFVGNTATSGYLDITAGTNMGTYTLSPGSGTNAGFGWDGLIFPASDPFIDVDGLLFTNSGVEINLYGNGPGSYTLAGAPTNLAYYAPLVTNGVATLAVCPQTIIRTWLATDACGNTNTCSQTVFVTAESLVYQGLTNTLFGNATLSVSSNQLTVGNLGSSGQDGVDIALPGGSVWEAHWLPLDPSNALPVGAYVQSQIIGTAGSVTNGLLGSWQMTKAGTSNYVVTADYSPIGVTTVTLQVYNGTNLVATRNGQSGALCMVNGCVNDDHWGNPVPAGPNGLPGLGGGGLTMFGPMSFTFQDSSTAQGDRLVILPEGGSSVSSLSEVRLLASGIPSIIITNEQAIPALTAREHIQNHVMLEAMANGYYLIQQEYGLDPASTITWTATYSETGWTGSIAGKLYNQSLTLNYSGTTVYDGGQNASNTFSASGSFGANGITINGTAVLGYNGATGGYTNMVFQDQGDVETPKLKWWAVAAEVIVGGYIGGQLADGAGVIAGAALAVTISDKVSSISVNGPDPTNPGTPTTPAPPANMTDALSFVPATNQIVAHVFGSGAEYANVGNQIVLNGNWGNGQASGFGHVGSSTMVQFAGLTHAALGSAVLNLQPNQLTISNIGSSGQDGVSVALHSVAQWAAAWGQLDPGGTALPLGAYLQMQLIGTANGVTNGVLGTVTSTKGASNCVVSADFSAQGATNLTVQVYAGTNLVGQVVGLPMGFTVYSDSPPPIPWMAADESACCSYGCDKADFTYESTVNFTIGLQVFSGNRLLIIPQGPPLNGAVSTVNLLASQIPSIVFMSEVVSPLVLNFAFSGTQLTLNWLGTGQLQQSGNLNTWTDLTNVVSPYVTPIGPTNLFYRIKQPMGDESF